VPKRASTYIDDSRVCSLTKLLKPLNRSAWLTAMKSVNSRSDRMLREKLCDLPVFVRRSRLGQGELVSAFGASSHRTLHRGCTAGTSKCPTVGYVKIEAAFWAMHNVLRLRTHSRPRSQNHPTRKILITFLQTLKGNDAEILTTLGEQVFPFKNAELAGKN
jgi:hypothetical protein